MTKSFCNFFRKIFTFLLKCLIISAFQSRSCPLIPFGLGEKEESLLFVRLTRRSVVILFNTRPAGETGRTSSFPKAGAKLLPFSDIRNTPTHFFTKFFLTDRIKYCKSDGVFSNFNTNGEGRRGKDGEMAGKRRREDGEKTGKRGEKRETPYISTRTRERRRYIYT